jgi:curli biogenesis system outer membrane secretion channel CsgG
MRTVKTIAAVATALLIVGNLAPFASAQRKMNIAIVEFEFNTADRGAVREAYGDVKNLGRQLADSLQNQVVNLGTFTVVERSRVEKIMEELRLGQSGALDPNTAAKLGRMLGADALVLGSIASVEISGLPTNGYNEKGWSPKYMAARLGLSFRLVDTSTAQILQAYEVIGQSAETAAKPTTTEKTLDNAQKKAGGNMLDKMRQKMGKWGNVVGDEPREEYRGPQVDDYKRVIREASDDAIAKMAQQLQQADTVARVGKRSMNAGASAKSASGRVISVEGKMIFIVDLDPAIVKEGDRLYVRRPKSIADRKTGKTIETTVKVGEVEIMEVQDKVMIGTFSGAVDPAVGDKVMNK